MTEEQQSKRERTLLLALMLSAWAPLVTGIAVYQNTSSTQVADFVRRSVELIALATAYWVFRRSWRDFSLSPEHRLSLKRRAGLMVTLALLLSAAVMLVMAISRVGSTSPGGNVSLGLAIAVLGLITNSWFWQRYAMLNREKHDTVINSQRNLYQAKAMVDLCVIMALLSVALWPGQRAAALVDIGGTVIVALYMAWRALQNAREAGLGQ